MLRGCTSLFTPMQGPELPLREATLYAFLWEYSYVFRVRSLAQKVMHPALKFTELIGCIYACVSLHRYSNQHNNYSNPPHSAKNDNYIAHACIISDRYHNFQQICF